MENILEVNHIKKYYKIKTGLLQKTQYVKAVDDVSFSIKKGQTFGLVGESGCGKSTLGKVIIRLEDATSGSIIVNGEDITRLQGKKTEKITTTISDDISRSVCIIESDANGWRYHFRTYFKL